jgi:tetratricopeptide (TPR) repeat protein
MQATKNETEDGWDYAVDIKWRETSTNFSRSSPNEERAGVRSTNLMENDEPLTLSLSPLGRGEGNVRQAHNPRDGRLKTEKGIFRGHAGCRFPFSIQHLRFLFLLAFAAFLAGCSPPGPRALVSGKKLLDRGDYDGAVAQLKTATSLLATNAAACNYYGVALQHAGQPADAAQAYQNALRFDRDLTEAHYNLGCLWLEQNKFADAKAEFTAYTLRRNNAPEGWLKLGAAQLKLRELPAAEKSFSTAYSLNTNNAEALNGLGLARVAGNRPQDAAKFFSAAVTARPDYAPALLNLATVQRQYLHDDDQALKNYRAYLALTPRPANWEAVNNLVNGFDQAETAATEKTPPAAEIEAAAPVKTNPVEAKPPVTATSRPLLPPKVQPGGTSAPTTPRQTTPPKIVTIPPEQPIVTAPNASIQEPPVQTAATGGTGRSQPTGTARPSVAAPPSQTYRQGGVTQLTSNNSASAPKPPPAAAPLKLVPPAPPTFPRYLYLSPSKPRAGDRKAADPVFRTAQKAELDRDLAAAMNSYRQAAGLDPSWFEAQYDYAVLAYQSHDFSHALTASEMALALQPDSVDARYNFALALKAAGYVTDAMNELKKIVTAHPNEARAQLALGNIYAEQMHDPAQARPHYLKWLELDPQNAQAINIRFWLSQNPP